MSGLGWHSVLWWHGGLGWHSVLARHSVLGVLALLLLAPMAGCSEEVASPRGLEEPYSMYGILNPRLDTQTVAISPIQPLLYDYPDSIDARVTSTDLETGETHVWDDSLIVTRIGQRDHVYHAGFRPRFGRSYELRVERSDGAVSSSVANVPEEVRVVSEDAGSQVVSVEILGDGIRVHDLSVLYRVRWHSGGTQDACESGGRTFAVPYERKESQIEGGYRLAVNVALDHEEVMRQYSKETPISWIPGSNGFALTGMTLRMIVAEEAWDPPGGAFDPLALAQPGTMTNVSNGYGFFGGGYNQDAAIYPSENVIGSSWFFDYLMRPPGSCQDYCGCGRG